MKFITTVLLVLLILLQYRLWTGNGSLPHVQHLEQSRQAQQEENNRLQERNRSLSAEVLDLKQGLEAIEERARAEMGMVKPGESFIQLIYQQNSSSEQK